MAAGDWLVAAENAAQSQNGDNLVFETDPGRSYLLFEDM